MVSKSGGIHIRSAEAKSKVESRKLRAENQARSKSEIHFCFLLFTFYFVLRSAFLLRSFDHCGDRLAYFAYFAVDILLFPDRKRLGFDAGVAMELVERIVGVDGIGVPHRKDLGKFATALSQPHCFPALQRAHQRTSLRAQLSCRNRFHSGSLTQPNQNQKVQLKSRKLKVENGTTGPRDH